ncbi:MAG: phosphoribosylamine--glycine ligase [Phycisphaeraceae bacterium]|nr:phosphoribosylamine--glycine ligase [Phycisphaeraceae bacterium]
MNILILGSGGREHALGWKIRQSPLCDRLYFAPGNFGTAQVGENLDLPIEPVITKHVDAIDYFCRHNKVELIVIGPEDPLAAGLADRLKHPSRVVFGPSAVAARIEADKAWSKQLMRSVSIPTAEARIFHDRDAAMKFVEHHETPVVVKAAGLAKGKGVIVTSSQAQAIDAVRRIMFNLEFGDAGRTVVIEEKLVGQEVSILALVDGRNMLILEPAQDHKQAHEGDKGPNTGGMGAYSPTPVITEELMREIEQTILVPTVDALVRDNITYRGVLYAGLMLTPGGPKVIEFNCRFGDPEIQAILPRLKGDLVELLLATATGKLEEARFDWDSRACCSVVMASEGYPGDYSKGRVISGLDKVAQMKDVYVFHAGTKADSAGRAVTSGGRVLNVSAMGDDLAGARELANEACSMIDYEGGWYRRDIGHRVMNRLSV